MSVICVVPEKFTRIYIQKIDWVLLDVKTQDGKQEMDFYNEYNTESFDRIKNWFKFHEGIEMISFQHQNVIYNIVKCKFLCFDLQLICETFFLIYFFKSEHWILS